MRNEQSLFSWDRFFLGQGHNVGAWLDPSPFLSPFGLVVVA
jgi:hypothetical protein